ncbi:MAG: hypothetical protein FJY80_09960 [Candidatus Aminicenantes bacterium]|nr:hypothetical protein [Candidatus Aminicenantes bacterium]
MAFPLDFYWHPRKAMDAVAKFDGPKVGLLFSFGRGVILSLFFYLPFHLLKFKPITPALLKPFDTPDYFLYAAGFWPLFGVLSCVYVSGATYVLFRLCGYRADLDKIINLGGLLDLAIGIVILLFDWLMVAVNFHTDPVFLGFAHIIIADPWSIAVSAIFFRKYFSVPYGLSVVAGILVRILYLPIGVVFIRT